MRYFLFVLSLFVLVLAALTLIAAKSAIHEIAGFVLILTAAVLFTGSAIVDAITELRGDLAKPRPAGEAGPSDEGRPSGEVGPSGERLASP